MQQSCSLAAGREARAVRDDAGADAETTSGDWGGGIWSGSVQKGTMRREEKRKVMGRLLQWQVVDGHIV